MSDELALLKAIQADPDDELSRLALADWLDDNGDPQRAEFVRVQCELARGVADKFRRAHLEERERQLLFEYVASWLGPFAETNKPICRYQRGTATITMHAMALLQPYTLPLAEKWFTRGWVLHLALSGSALNLSELFTQPWLGQLSGLRLDKIQASSLMDALLGCDQLGGLRQLGLIAAGMAGQTGWLRKTPAAESIGTLDLGQSGGTPADIAELGRGFPRLRQLNLSGNALRPEHVNALLGADWLEQLTTLQLVGCSLSRDGLARLLASPRLASLEALNLSNNLLFSDGAQLIAASPHLPSLRRLGLRNTRISGQGAVALTRLSLPLEMLDVWDSRVGRAGVDKLRERFGAALWMRLEEPPCWGD